MGIRNNNIELEYQSLFIPVTKFSGVGLIPDVTLDSDPAGDTLEFDIASSGAQGAPLSEIGSTGLVGLEINAQSSVVKHFMSAPTFMDTESDIYVRAHWTSASNVTTDTFTVTVTYRQFGDGDTIGSGLAAALNTAIPADNVSGNLDYQVTSAGTVNAGTLDVDANDGLEWIVTITFAADDNNDGTPDGAFDQTKHFIGLEFFYLPKLTPGAQKAKVALPSKVVVAE